MSKTLRQLVDAYARFKERVNTLSAKQRIVVAEFEKKASEEKIKKVKEKINSSS